MTDLNKSMRMRKPKGYGANICDGLKGGWTEKLTKPEMKEIITLLARIGESSYRRGVQQGSVFHERGVLPKDLHDWRYGNCIDFAPPADQALLNSGIELAVDRLYIEEYWHGLVRMGIFE
jgi:hypothetical protein